MKDCIFCSIIKGELKTKFVYRDDDVFVFSDIKPKARTHFLIVPRVHIKTFLDIKGKQYVVLTKMIKVVQTLVKEQKLTAGYRVMINGGRHQEIPHLHFHLLGD